ncbi:MAG TPA: protein-disulfide reductase DsbD domain-containing protein [Pyrinomonadaceae bacterium]|nr:protein-disulfide reductase DsbD domain-containing protein [Pyrinomonadaceae bacterium]
MKRKLCLSLPLVVVLALAALLSACANNSSTQNAPANSQNTIALSNSNAAATTPAPKSPLEGIVSANVERVELKAGETADVNVHLSITSGYHVNANPATEKFLIPTSLNVKPDAGITVEKTTYPKPLTKKFPFAEVPLAVYEGDAVIKLTLNASREAQKGQHTLGADIRVQPCDDEKCYPPSTIKTGVEVTIR